MPTAEDVKENPLARWMTRFRVTNREFGARAKIAENYVGALRSGLAARVMGWKVAIQKATREMELDLGVTDPVGVPIAEWFTEADVEQLDAARGISGGR